MTQTFNVDRVFQFLFLFFRESDKAIGGLITFLQSADPKCKEYEEKKDQKALDGLVAKFVDLMYDAVVVKFSGQ